RRPGILIDLVVYGVRTFVGGALGVLALRFELLLRLRSSRRFGSLPRGLLGRLLRRLFNGLLGGLLRRLFRRLLCDLAGGLLSRLLRDLLWLLDCIFRRRCCYGWCVCCGSCGRRLLCSSGACD